MTHIPTGIKVVRDGRSQHENRALALEEITKRVNHFYRTGHLQEESTVRKSQIGEGARSDKRRTYRVKDGIVIDHITNRTVGIRDVLRGRIDLFINEGVV